VAWTLWLTGAEPKRIDGTLIYGFATGYFADMVFDKADWNFHGQDLAYDLARALDKTGQALDAVNPDLSAFRDAGGKLIQYHGWNDAAIPAPSSIQYYQEVAAKLGGIEKTEPFYRLFMAPGMQHCGLGLGPNAVGGVFGLPSPAHDPAHDVVAALAHWVEDGAAPDQIIATLYRDNDPSKGIVAQRPWCAHPAVARFSDQGSRTEAASYICTAPPK
jgi:feruloyl esterase